MNPVYESFLVERGWTIDDYFHNTFPIVSNPSLTSFLNRKEKTLEKFVTESLSMMSVPMFDMFLEKERMSGERYIEMTMPMVEHMCKSHANVDDFKLSVESGFTKVMQRELPSIITENIGSSLSDNISNVMADVLTRAPLNDQMRVQLKYIEDNLVRLNKEKDIDKQIVDFMNNISKHLRCDILDEKCSSLIGQKAERAYENILNCMEGFEIEHVGRTDDTMDIKVRNPDISKPIVFLEIKHHSRNVPTKEVKKFTDNMMSQQCHGLMIASVKGICLKTDWKVEIHEGRISLYLTNVNYDEKKIMSGLQLIYQMDEFLKENKHSTPISNKNLKMITALMEQRAHQLMRLKMHAKNMRTALELQLMEFESFALDDVLDILRVGVREIGLIGGDEGSDTSEVGENSHLPHGTFVKVCNHCGVPVCGKNKASLGAGMSKHKNHSCEVIGDGLIDGKPRKDGFKGDGSGRDLRPEAVFRDNERFEPTRVMSLA